MHRLYNLLTVMVVMVGAFFATHEAVAKLLTGTGGNDELLGTNEADRLKGRAGNDRLSGRVGNDHLWGGRGDNKIRPGGGNDKVVAAAGDDLVYARDPHGADYIDCGTGRDQVETIHRDDNTLSNCERALGPRLGDIKTGG
jgi:hypothetical protein